MDNENTVWGQDVLVARELNDARGYWRRAYDAVVDNRRRQIKLREELSELAGKEPQLVQHLKDRREKFQAASEGFMSSGVMLEAVHRPIAKY
jgi:hypothetical protein